MKLRVYVDTSVFSGLLDEREPARQEDTKLFFARLHEFEASTSEQTRREVEQTHDERRRAELLTLLEKMKVVPLSAEARALADRYVEAGVFSVGTADDAVHVAAAVLGGYHVLASWNFKHLVNRRRRSSVNDANIAWGLPTVDILAPAEI